MQIEVTHDTSASVDAVWAVMTDLARWAQVLSSVSSIERLDDGDGFAAGTRWRETRRVRGRELSEILEVTGVDDDSSYVVEATSRGVDLVARMRVDPMPPGARLSATFGSEGGRRRRLMARTFGRAIERTVRATLEQDLRDIAAAAERRATADDEDDRAGS